MSRTAGRVIAGFSRRWSPNLGLGQWPVLCTAMAHGCLYVEPMWSPPLNQPPDILFPEDNPAILEMLSDPTIAQVVADDDEDDTLSFGWFVPNSPNLVPQTKKEPAFWVSTLSVPLSAVRDGDTITVIVGDTDNNNESVHFDVVLP
jgi:hypothetical protein